KEQLAVQVSSKADYDQAAADLKAKQAAVAQQQVNVAKKQLRAPFAGRAGIVTINPGAYLSSGTMIVTLQQLDPVYVDFHLPQKDLAELRTGQKVTLMLDAFPGRTFAGTVNAISPKVDSDTRNVQVEARVPNPDRVLTPGPLVAIRSRSSRDSTRVWRSSAAARSSSRAVCRSGSTTAYNRPTVRTRRPRNIEHPGTR